MTSFKLNKPHNWNELHFFEKISYYSKNLNKDYAIFVDKIEAKKIVKSICGNDIHVPKLIRILNDYSDININDINTKYIIKASHGSKWNINITDQNITIDEIINKLKSYNKIYSFDEIQYNYIPINFFIEEKIIDKYLGKTGDAIVHHFWCFYGEVKFISVLVNKNENDFYDTKWNLLNEKTIKIKITKPTNLNKLIMISEKLSSPFEFVRMDYYFGKNNIIYFSEFTFTPCGGLNCCWNPKIDSLLSSKWFI